MSTLEDKTRRGTYREPVVVFYMVYHDELSVEKREEVSEWGSKQLPHQGCCYWVKRTLGGGWYFVGFSETIPSFLTGWLTSFCHATEKEIHQLTERIDLMKEEEKDD